jgi:hypothetical protein
MEHTGCRGDEEEPHRHPDEAEGPVAAACLGALGRVVVDLASGVAATEGGRPDGTADRQRRSDQIEK